MHSITTLTYNTDKYTLKMYIHTRNLNLTYFYDQGIKVCQINNDQKLQKSKYGALDGNSGRENENFSRS